MRGDGTERKTTPTRSPRLATVPFAAIDGLHPALAAQGWLGSEYFLNDLSVLTPDAVAGLLLAHPIVLGPAARTRRRAPAAAAATSADSVPDVAAESGDAASSVARPERSPATIRYVVVGGIRSWQVAAAVDARREDAGQRFRVRAIVLPREDAKVVVARAHAERYLDELVFCLKPAVAAARLAERWAALRATNDALRRALTPSLTTQDALMLAVGYQSRSAFRPRGDPAGEHHRDGEPGAATRSPRARTRKPSP